MAKKLKLEGGQNTALAVAGRAHAAGNLDVLQPGDPGYGGKVAAPKRLGLRVESDKQFQLSKDTPASELIRVFDTDPTNKQEEIVVFSGSRKQAERVLEALDKFFA